MPSKVQSLRNSIRVFVFSASAISSSMTLSGAESAMIVRRNRSRYASSLIPLKDEVQFRGMTGYARRTQLQQQQLKTEEARKCLQFNQSRDQPIALPHKWPKSTYEEIRMR